ncbi:MAG: hypothetical protein K6U04_01570 [Armatimonadetes bacterium]|nr:hypothetical protein [Armatimonadota bacterium]
MSQGLANALRVASGSYVEKAPWVLQITEYKGKQAPVLVVKKRVSIGCGDRGIIYGQPLRRCFPVIRSIISGVNDDKGIPLEIQRFLNKDRITFRGNLPLDEEAGTKLLLIFMLQEHMKDMDRVELIAWRVERFSYEEAAYWLSRATHYGDSASRWARAGMRLMLGGQPGDKAIPKMLEKYRRFI